jgi:drug/metabolite transporter (DMT)-like permease
VVAVVGVGLLCGHGGFAAPGAGDLLIVLAAVARAVHVTAIGRFAESRSLDSGRLTLVQLCTCALVFTVLSPFTGTGVIAVAAQMSWRAWLLVFYLAAVCTVFAFGVQTWAVRRSSPTRVSLLLGTEPLWAAVCGAALGGDPVTLLGVAGAALVLTGVNWGRRIEARTSTDHPSRDVSQAPMTSTSSALRSNGSQCPAGTSTTVRSGQAPRIGSP